MSSLDDIRSSRLKKLEALKNSFDNIYPSRTNATHSVADVVKNFSNLLKGRKALTIVGRVRGLRPHGSSIFFDMEQDSARFQGYIRKEELSTDLFKAFSEGIDVGDIVELTGKAFLTKKKEKSLLVSKWRPLAKSLHPLPEKWHGLKDVEERFRMRALDLLSNDEVMAQFRTRARAVTFLRSYLDKLDFLEVETPILQSIPGGTNAEPFKTHHETLDLDLYLRIAPELYLKRLVVGGYSRVYEIGRNFRNEGIDVTHNPEFTMLEAYTAYSDYNELMKFLEEMIKKLFTHVIKKKDFTYQTKSISIKKPFKKMSFADALRQYALLNDTVNIKKDDLIITAKRLGVDANSTKDKSKLLDEIFKKAARPHLIQPTFVYDWPKSLLPLAKRKEGEDDVAESFQLYIGGLEILKGFTELNDPIDQRRRFEEQEALRSDGDKEAQYLDEDYIKNLELGLPPTAGFGLGIDRLALLLTDTRNIREVILFPTLRPKT